MDLFAAQKNLKGYIIIFYFASITIFFLSWWINILFYSSVTKNWEKYTEIDIVKGKNIYIYKYDLAVMYLFQYNKYYGHNERKK